MTETMIVSSTVDAPTAKVFGVLADPANHQAIDGTGWVRESLDGKPLTEAGQIFRIAMYHDNHPDGHYEMANKVIVCEPDLAIGWEPGQAGEDGALEFGGWIWHYDLEPVSPQQTPGRSHLRLVRGVGDAARAHRVPAVSSRAPRELALEPGDAGRSQAVRLNPSRSARQ